MPNSNYHSASAFEAVYSALHFFSIIILLVKLCAQITFSNWPALCIGLLFALQMLRMYSVLHNLDEQAKDKTHFLAYLEGCWLLLERLMRLVIAATVILLARFSHDGMVDVALEASSTLDKCVKSLGESYAGLSGIVEIEQRLDPGTTIAFSLALFMVVIYALFIHWDLLVITTTNIACKAGTCIPHSKRMQALVHFHKP